MKKFKYGELFCGPGGMALGAKLSKITHNGNHYGLSHAWANDIDEDSCKTYLNNICPGDFSTIKVKEGLSGNGKVSLLGLESVTNQQRYLFNSGKLEWSDMAWSKLINTI